MMAFGAVMAVIAGTAVGAGGNTNTTVVHQQLTPSSATLAACMPEAKVKVTVRLRDTRDSDIFRIHATGLPPDTQFTTFLLETAGPPFGAAEYIGDFTSNHQGDADAEFRLIVGEAFSFTLVNGVRARVDLNQVGAWFADPTGDDFCLGPNSPVTPFDGDGQAGVQAFNSAQAEPLP
jgi:hypothetical protein